MSRKIHNIYAPCHAKTYADSEGPNQPAHPHSLIRAFAYRSKNHWLLQNGRIECECPDETLRMHRIICICAFCVYSKALFNLARPIYENQL